MARTSYVDPNTIEDEDIREFFEEARHTGTPRPEIQAIRAHQPDVIRSFMYSWNPDEADDELWADLHRHFTEPELVELGAFIGFIAGGQRWIHTLHVKHGEVLFETTTGLNEQVAQELQTASVG